MRDRKRCEIKKPIRLGHVDIISYALEVTGSDKTSKPSNFKEAISCEEAKL